MLPPSVGEPAGSHARCSRFQRPSRQIRRSQFQRTTRVTRITIRSSGSGSLSSSANGRSLLTRTENLMWRMVALTFPPRQSRRMQELDELSERFWAWRARQQPRTRDDIPRLVRPRGWRPEVEAALAVQRREELGAFAAELALIRPDEVPDRVDHRLLRSALGRVLWESDVLRVRGIPRFWRTSLSHSTRPMADRKIGRAHV